MEKLFLVTISLKAPDGISLNELATLNDKKKRDIFLNRLSI